MKKILAASASLMMLAGAAQAQTAAPAAPAPEWTVAGNVSLNSDYRFRGFTQTNYGAALQGGIDITHSSGFYVGNWNSNVAQDLYNGASLEMDFYGGFKGEVAPGLGYDVGAIYYYYPQSIVTAGTTWLGDNYPMCLLYGSLVEANVFLKGEADLQQNYEKLFIDNMGLLKSYADGRTRNDNFRTPLPRGKYQ